MTYEQKKRLQKYLRKKEDEKGKQFQKEIKGKKPESLFSRKNIGYVVLIAAIIGVPAIFIFAGPGQSVLENPAAQYQIYDWFSKPPAPPLNESIGLCIIRAYNGTHYIAGNVDLYWYDNESYYTTVQTNTTILLNGTTWGVFNTTGYYPMSVNTIYLKGSGSNTGTPTENLVNAVLIAHKDNVTAEIVSIDGNSALHYVANITDGEHYVRIHLTNLEWYSGILSYWGVGTILPRTVLPPIQNNTLPSNVYIGASLWFTINGSLENPQYRLSSGSFNDVYMWQPFSWCNSTPIDFLAIEHEFIIKGNWSGITGIRLSDMFMDNILDRYINLT